MTNEYITIQDAAELSNKSVQTIRRAIKAGKLKNRKRKTPQGFNYSIARESLSEFYGLRLEEKNLNQETVKETVSEEPKKKIKRPVELSEEKTTYAQENYITTDDFQAFTKTLEKLVSQHADERQNFLRLVNTLQEKIFVLENQLSLLGSPEKKWFHFWK